MSCLYHEQQLSALCGVHALNNLMQGPVCGAGDLAQIAHRLDEAERVRSAPYQAQGGPSQPRGLSRSLCGPLTLFPCGRVRSFRARAQALLDPSDVPAAGTASHRIDVNTGDFSLEARKASP